MSSPVLRRPLRSALVLACASALTIGAAGCGSSKGGGGNADADPATAAPATAPIYASLVIQPDGTLKTNAESVLKKILGTDDPVAKIEKAIQDADTEGPKVDVKKDIEPWLGKRAGVFVSSFSGANADAAAVIATKDTDKAKAFLKKDAEDSKPKGVKKSYKGTDYYVSDNTAEAVVGDFVVVGSVKGLQTVVDTVKDKGASLATVADYKTSQSDVGASDGLAAAYINTSGIVDAIAASGKVPPQALTVVRQALATAAPKALGAKLTVGQQQIAFETAAKIKASSTAAPAGDAAGALAKIPGDAWFGVGIGAIGEKGTAALAQIGQLGGLGGIGVDTLLNTVKSQTGIDVKTDLLSWMGDGALFVRGTSLADIGGALVVQSSNPARTKLAIGKIAKAIRTTGLGGLAVQETSIAGTDRAIELSDKAATTGIKVYVASAGDQFVIAVGEQALQAALKPSTTLATNPDYVKAKGQLGAGYKPVFFLSIPPILDLAEGLNATSNPDYAKAKPYLDTFAAIVAGSTKTGDLQKAKVAITLK